MGIPLEEEAHDQVNLYPVRCMICRQELAEVPKEQKFTIVGYGI